MVGELQVTAAPIPDPRQEEPNSKLYRAEGESKPFYNVRNYFIFHFFLTNYLLNRFL